MYYINAMPCYDPENAWGRRDGEEQDWLYSQAGTEAV